MWRLLDKYLQADYQLFCSPRSRFARGYETRPNPDALMSLISFRTRSTPMTQCHVGSMDYGAPHVRPTAPRLSSDDDMDDDEEGDDLAGDEHSFEPDDEFDEEDFDDDFDEDFEEDFDEDLPGDADESESDNGDGLDEGMEDEGD
jgi:hypothetical protein